MTLDLSQSILSFIKKVASICLAVFLLFQSCSSRKHDTPSNDNTDDKSSRVEVMTSIVRRRAFEYPIVTSGKVRAAVEMRITSRTDGVISKINVQNGAFVKSGEVLMQLENAREELALERARVLLRERQVVYDDQMVSYSLTSDTARQNKAMENILLSSGLASAQISYLEARMAFDNTLVKAPIDGIISDADFTPGIRVTNGQMLFKIHSPGKYLVECNIIESDAVSISTSSLIDVQTLFESKQTFKAKLLELNPRVSETSNLVKVRIQILDNADLLPGMSVQVKFKVPLHNCISIPKEAVIVRSGKKVVFSIQENLAKWNYVSLGKENGSEVEVLEGLSEGQEIIISNNLQLVQDTEVSKIVEKKL